MDYTGIVQLLLGRGRRGVLQKLAEPRPGITKSPRGKLYFESIKGGSDAVVVRY
jgi:hypothetical protein